MKVKQINDSTIKITIKLEDLEEHGMDLSDFLVPQEKTEEFFYAILEELEMPENFLDSGMLSFRVTPKSDRLDVFVTKSNVDKQLNFNNLGELPDLEEFSNMSPDDFIKTLEKTIGEKTQADIEAIESLAKAEEKETSQEDKVEPERYIYYILQFSSLAETVAYAKIVDFEVDTSELYKMDHHYFLTILVDLKNKPHAYPVWLLARIREFADDTHVTRAVLQEHGRTILASEAISSLCEVASL